MAKQNPNNNNNEVTYHIATMSIVKVLSIALLAVVVWSLLDIIGLLFVAIVLASALDPFVDRMQRYHIPRGVSILLVYLLIILAVILVISLLVPPLIAQLSGLGTTLITYSPQIDALMQYITRNPDSSLVDSFRQNIANISSSFSSLSSGVFTTVQNFFGVVASLMFVLVITFYITIDEDGLKKFIRSVAPIQYQPYLVQKTNRIQDRLGTWLSGQLVLMLLIGIITYIGLSLLGVKYALVLALVAGLFEFVPFIGPLISAVPAVFFAFTDSPWKAGAVVVFYLVLQQLENQVLVPKIMQRALGLSPIVIITGMLIGAKIAGLVGILLAVPAVTIIWIFSEDFIAQKMRMDNRLEE